MLNSIYSCFRLVRSVHHGLYDAWLFGFFANDNPSTLVKPEYIATVMVGKSIADRFIKNSGATGLSLKLEEKANTVATHSFGVPPFPLKKRSVPSRSSRNGHERIDITIFSDKIKYLKVSRAVIEIKISHLPCHLKADLLRNKQLMELSDPRSNNYLQIACLGFIVVDNKSMCINSAKTFRSNLKKEYSKLANNYLSNKYKVHVSVRELCSPPAEEDEVGVFMHMASVVISFIRV